LESQKIDDGKTKSFSVTKTSQSLRNKSKYPAPERSALEHPGGVKFTLSVNRNDGRFIAGQDHATDSSLTYNKTSPILLAGKIEVFS
jgi:hypothetical protein